MEWLKWMAKKAASISGAGASWDLVDTVPRDADDPLHLETEQIRRLLAEYRERKDEFHRFWDADIKKLAASEPIIAADRAQQARYATALLVWLILADENMDRLRASAGNDPYIHRHPNWPEVWMPRSILSATLNVLLQRNCHFRKTTLGRCSVVPARPGLQQLSSAAGRHECHRKSRGGTSALRAMRDLCQQFLEKLSLYKSDSVHRKYMQRLEAVLGQGPEIPIEPGEAWADVALADLAPLAVDQREAWSALLLHARDLGGANPSAQWLRRMKELLGAIPSPVFISFVTRWFPLTDKKPKVSAISEEQWRARCADGELSRHYLALHSVPQGFQRIKAEMNAAQDPWVYLRHFSNQPLVGSCMAMRLRESVAGTLQSHRRFPVE